MREIKFRVFDKETKQMFYPLKDSVLPRIDYCEFLWLVADVTNGSTEPNNYFLMQFTGLLDKNGKEIYCGDIMQSEHAHMECHGKCKITVCWDESKNGWNFRPTVIDIYDMEIIGNIYESPELLE